MRLYALFLLRLASRGAERQHYKHEFFRLSYGGREALRLTNSRGESRQ